MKDTARLERSVEAALRESLACLTSSPWAKPDGGIGRDPAKRSDLWSTAEVLVLACKLGNLNVVSQGVVDGIKGHVLALQRDDGSWASDAGREPDSVGTTLVLMALRHWREDETVVTAAEKGLAWLAENQNGDGGWDVTAFAHSARGVSTAYPTIHAYEAISEWFLDNVGPIESAQQALNNARNWLLKARQPGAGIREDINAADSSVRHTAYAVLVDRSAGGLDLLRKSIHHWLEHKQHKDGSWGLPGSPAGDVETTAAAMRALLVLGSAPQGKRVHAAIESLLEKRVEQVIAGHRYSGWPTKPGGPPASWPTYYALLALHDYREALRAPSGPRQRVRFPHWRRATSSALLAIFAAGALATLEIIGSNPAFTAVLTTLAAGASIVIAMPLLINGWRKISQR